MPERQEIKKGQIYLPPGISASVRANIDAHFLYPVIDRATPARLNAKHFPLCREVLTMQIQIELGTV
jgi:hypothetical protein